MTNQTILLLVHLHLPRKYDNSISHLNMDLNNTWFISIFHGWEMLQQNLKNKLVQPFSVASLVLKLVLFSQPGPFFPQPRRLYYLSITTIMLFISLCATVIVGTWDVDPKSYKNPLSNMFPDLSETIILLKIALNFPVPAIKTALFKLFSMTLRLDSISWKTLPVPANTVTLNSLSLPEDILLSIFPLLKLLLSHLFNLMYVDNRNFFTV